MKRTSQLSSDGLEGELAELLGEGPKMGAAHQLMFAIVQLKHWHQTIGQDSFHQYTVPAVKSHKW